MTNDNGLEGPGPAEQIRGLILCDTAIDIATDMAQELWLIYEDIQAASNDPDDGAHIRQLCERWEEWHSEWRRWVDV